MATTLDVRFGGTMHGLMARFAMSLVRPLVCDTRARHRMLALSLLPILLALVPLAYANPTDQTWLVGFYDDADFDDVVLTVVSASGVVTDVVLLSTEAADTASGGVWDPPQTFGVAADSSRFTIRAPPSTARVVTK